jgi:hypothetical protein
MASNWKKQQKDEIAHAQQTAISARSSNYERESDKDARGRIALGTNGFEFLHVTMDGW